MARELPALPRATNKSPRTVETYCEALVLLGRFVAEAGMPADRTKLTREHIEAFITHLLDRFKPATANNQYQALQALYKWLDDEGELDRNPMERMKPPIVPEAPPARVHAGVKEAPELALSNPAADPLDTISATFARLCAVLGS